MPLPLPNLDTRRWNDLVAEGQALIPRYSPTWTDHNLHDPGITLMELLAWQVEQDIYRVNRVPDRHRRKFLVLAGFPPTPPQPAETVLAFSLAGGAGVQAIPAGTTFSASAMADNAYAFRTQTNLNVVPTTIAAIQVFDGARFADQTRLWRDGLVFSLFGSDPSGRAESPALYIGLDQPLPVGTEATFWFWFASGRSDRTERERLAAEGAELAEFCRPVRPQRICYPGPGTGDVWCGPDDNGDGADPDAASADAGSAPEQLALPAHHSVRTVWEYASAGGWRTLDPESGEVDDDTRGFTLDGPVRITLPTAVDARSVGAVGDAHFYLRCRLVAGPPDTAPLAAGIALNSVAARQAVPMHSTLAIAPGVTPPAGREPVPGTRQNLFLALDDYGQIDALAAGPDVDGPQVLVLRYQPAGASAQGELEAALVVAGQGSGLPDQQMWLPAAPIAGGQADVWLGDAAGLAPWQQRPDFDASSRTDAHFTLDATTGALVFGNGELGRVAPMGATVFAAYRTTAGSRGNVPAGAEWSLLGADDTLNEALLGGDLTALDGALSDIGNPFPATGGADQESLFHAAGRAAQALWAHERLLDLCAELGCDTLDQLPRTSVLARVAPQRATTLLDYERLALEVPGTAVSRAKAWAGIDPAFACASAPGTVTVVIIPSLPPVQPEPAPGLLEAVHHFLNRRRIVGTRLVVVGPSYLRVQVVATVRARAGADPQRVQDDIVTALDAFLNAVSGGPSGYGWPFGRDVYRSEILQVIDGVAGVNHVLNLELVPDEGEAQCGNLCLGPTSLVAPGDHLIDVVAEYEDD